MELRSDTIPERTPPADPVITDRRAAAAPTVRPAQKLRPAAITDGEYHSLLVALAVPPDPSDPRDRCGKRYPLVSMLVVAVCAALAGACTFAAITDWVRDLGG